MNFVCVPVSVDAGLPHRRPVWYRNQSPLLSAWSCRMLLTAWCV